MATELLTNMKDKLGVLSTVTIYDDEITELIEFAKADLAAVGILKIDETDVLIKRAVSCYVKGQFRYTDETISKRFMYSYESIKLHLYGSIEYAYYTVTINAGEQTEVTFNNEIKYTNESGAAVFYIKPTNHVKYTVNSVDYYVDITGDLTITVE